MAGTVLMVAMGETIRLDDIMEELAVGSVEPRL